MYYLFQVRFSFEMPNLNVQFIYFSQIMTKLYLVLFLPPVRSFWGVEGAVWGDF